MTKAKTKVARKPVVAAVSAANGALDDLDSRDRDERAARPDAALKPTGHVKLTSIHEARHYEWLKRQAMTEQADRQNVEAITPEMMIAILVRRAYAADPFKSGAHLTTKTGPRNNFDAKNGSFSR